MSARSKHSSFVRQARFLAALLLIAWAAIWLGSRLREACPQNKAARVSQRLGQWERLDGCTLVEDRNNDGDSFLVRHGGEEYTFRLYFVDCPEKRRHQYNGERIAEQGRYFGGLGEEATIRLGEQARDFALDELQRGNFTVSTKWETVFNSGRFYASVTLKNGTDLGQELVSRGLARIHTQGVDLPDRTTRSQATDRLREMEATARKNKRGGWSRGS